MADDERLEELEEHIQEARKHAREALGEHDPGEREFYESGDEPESKEEDDQTIAPG